MALIKNVYNAYSVLTGKGGGRREMGKREKMNSVKLNSTYVVYHYFLTTAGYIISMVIRHTVKLRTDCAKKCATACRKFHSNLNFTLFYFLKMSTVLCREMGWEETLYSPRTPKATERNNVFWLSVYLPYTESKKIPSSSWGLRHLLKTNKQVYSTFCTIILSTREEN